MTTPPRADEPLTAGERARVLGEVVDRLRRDVERATAALRRERLLGAPMAEHKR